MNEYGRIIESLQKQKIMPSLNVNIQISQISMLLAVVAASMMVTFLISSIDQSRLQQFVFAQQGINASAYDKTITYATFPQIHNFTSSGQGSVNSWIIESVNGVVVVDTQRTLSEAKKLKDEVKKINKPISRCYYYTSSSRPYRRNRNLAKWNYQCSSLLNPICV